MVLVVSNGVVLMVVFSSFGGAAVKSVVCRCLLVYSSGIGVAGNDANNAVHIMVLVMVWIMVMRRYSIDDNIGDSVDCDITAFILKATTANWAESKKLPLSPGICQLMTKKKKD